MLIEHRGVTPRVAATAYVAPTAVVCGDVEIGDECRVMFGAVLVAEDAPVRVAGRTVIMENAVVRAWPQLPLELGHDVMIGPGANVNGAQIDDDAFVAAGATIFPAAHIGERAIVRTNGVVHINSELPPGRVVPEGWTAIGRPAEIVPPGQDERILFSLYGMNFTKAVFGESRVEVGMKNYLELFGGHRSDRPIVWGATFELKAPAYEPGARSETHLLECPREPSPVTLGERVLVSEFSEKRDRELAHPLAPLAVATHRLLE